MSPRSDGLRRALQLRKYNNSHIVKDTMNKKTDRSKS